MGALEQTGSQFNLSVMSNYFQPHGLNDARLPCPSPIMSLHKLISIELVITSIHLILCHRLLLLTSVFPNIRVYSSESVLDIMWLRYWSLSFSISTPNEYSGLISFRTDLLDFSAVQGTVRALPQHQSLKVQFS